MQNININIYFDRINNLSDENLLKAFKQREDYEPKAIELIIAIAKERNLIDENFKIIVNLKKIEPITKLEQFNVSKNQQNQIISDNKRPQAITYICIFGILLSLFGLIQLYEQLYNFETSTLITYLTQTLKGIFVSIYILIIFGSIVIYIGLWKMLSWAAWSYIILQVIVAFYELFEGHHVSGMIKLVMAFLIIYHSDKYFPNKK